MRHRLPQSLPQQRLHVLEMRTMVVCECAAVLAMETVQWWARLGLVRRR